MTTQNKYDGLIEGGTIIQGRSLWTDNPPEIIFTLLVFVMLALAAYLFWRFRKRLASLVTSRLHRPVNRAGFALLVVCFAAFTLALLMAVSDGDGSRLLTRVLDPGERSYDTYDHLARYSLGGIVLGAWLAWAYEPTFGRLIRWIKKG